MIYVLGIFVFVIILGVIVLIHEGGHFLFARRAKILCHEFSIGMGPLIWKTKKGETVYAIRGIPIGGYVAMAGEEVEQDYLKDVKEVKLDLDENNRVTRIILDIENDAFKDLTKYKLVSYNISGTMEGLEDELYLVVSTIEENEDEVETTLIVNRDAMLYFNKKEEYQIAPLNRNFASKKIGQRFMTVFAGPLMNFILALVIYFVIGLVQGYPNEGSTKLLKVESKAPVYTSVEDEKVGLRGGETITHLNGIEVNKWEDISEIMDEYASGNSSFNGVIEVKYKTESGKEKTYTFAPAVSIVSIELALDSDETMNNKVIVGKYVSNNEKTKSYKAGLREGDQIIKLTAGDYSKDVVVVNDILSFFTNDKLEKGQDVKVTYIRDNETKEVEIEVYSKQMLETQEITQTKVQLGISPEYKFNLLKTIYMPFVQTGASCLGIFKTLGLLFTDSSVNIDDFSGPVGIFQLVTSTLQSGILALLSLTAFLSVNIGFVNLLPLPALDGGRLAFILYEAITRKKPSPKVENIVHTIGFLLLMLLFVVISFSDILRIFGCK